VITIEGITKRYGRFTAVDDVSFTALPQQVTGFLGPNGAGKTTTLRVLSGLTPADGGAATIGGYRFRDIPNPGRHVGVLLDASAQHAGRTGREVLTVAALTMGLPTSRVGEMLEMVGLSAKEARRRVRNYSLGMRQRLGIAHALLGDPQVLILDEPANGLDPAGIRWMRSLLRWYAERGGTVLLSSHLLHEVELIADQIVVIGNGRIVASGSKDELLAGAGTFVRAADNGKLADVLRTAGAVVTPSADGVIVDHDAPWVGETTLAAGIALVELRPAGSSGLEELFLQLTADTQRDEFGHSRGVDDVLTEGASA
jgi:ABC-2 type transport system ATP-binding protein